MQYYTNYSYDFGADGWVHENLTLSEFRNYAAAIQLSNQSWWVTGGYDNNIHRLSSTEVLFTDNETGLQTFQSGPDLPVAVNAHCIARVNESYIFLAGGNTFNTYLFDENTSTFHSLPDLPYLRNRPACSVVKFNNRSVLIVAGGVNYEEPTVAYTTDIFDEPSGRWQLGPWIDGEHKWSNGGYVTYNDERGLVLVGGLIARNYLPEYILHYNETLATFERLSRNTNYAREDPAVVMIPTGGIDCE